MTYDRLNVNLTIKYKTLIAGLLVTLAAIVLYAWLSQDGPRVEGVMATAAAGIALTALAYTAMSVHLLLDNQTQAMIIGRKMYTATLVTQWNSPEVKKLMMIVDAMRGDLKTVDPKALADTVLNDDNKKVAVYLTLNFLENMGMAIEHDLADEAFLKDYFRDIVRIYYFALKPVILARRDEWDSNEVFVKFEKLSERWK